jgi:hypothetical protein
MIHAQFESNLMWPREVRFWARSDPVDRLTTSFELFFALLSERKATGVGARGETRGVIKIRLGRKKAHTIDSVPESVAVRIHTLLLNSR